MASPLYWSGVTATATLIKTWAARNRLYGVKDYSLDENYYKIASPPLYGATGYQAILTAMYGTNPERFLPVGTAPVGTAG